MPDKTKTDLLMKFVRKGGERVNAECVLSKNPKDGFMEDFHPATYSKFSDFFEISKFSFGVEVKDDDTDVGGLSPGTGGKTDDGKGQAGPKAKGGFVSWRNATESEAAAIDYPLQFDTCSFTRPIDSASPIFFQACCNNNTFESATLVKRVSTGGPEQAVGFLRLDFKEVLIIGINWDDGDVISESCRFICQSFRVQYRQQSASGQLQGAVPAHWDQAQDARRQKSGSR